MKFNPTKFLLGAGLALACTAADAQLLEDIIVETYYISDADDATDTDGGTLPAGSTTYRVFVDMAPGANLETVYGAPAHTLFINSTTGFFNNEDRGETTGEAIGNNRLGDNTVAVDSWVSFGGASSARLGVLKTADTDGSIVGGANNDGGSAGIATGLLKNADPNAGIPLTTADGLILGTAAGVTLLPGAGDFAMFADANSTTNYSTNSGGWTVLGGAPGVDQAGTNRILIGQFTVLAGGQLSFELNMRINDGQGNFVDFVANNPTGNEVVHPGLTFPQALDCEGTPGGTALPGSACDDGLATTGDDTWDANCNCVGLLIDCEGIPGGGALPGMACDDGMATTGSDTWDANCNCVGLLIDCEGHAGGSALPGTPCDDGDPNTTGEMWDANCNCVGGLVDDCLGVPGGSALPGTACDDGDPNTTGE
ncbi:MAG: hypothetical protein KDB87_15005, partial [Flavobacteriales bacterium]|nr:hypothetical protein [Flavobacteriales bacterium]